MYVCVCTHVDVRTGTEREHGFGLRDWDQEFSQQDPPLEGISMDSLLHSGTTKQLLVNCREAL